MQQSVIHVAAQSANFNLFMTFVFVYLSVVIAFFSPSIWLISMFYFSYPFHVLQTVFENRIYTVSLTCGDKYPNTPPQVRFVTKINMHSVSKHTGNVDASRCQILRNWSRNHGIETVLLELRREMASSHNRRLPQPAEGSYFWSILNYICSVILWNSHSTRRIC